jgi:hypothetical protein
MFDDEGEVLIDQMDQLIYELDDESIEKAIKTQINQKALSQKMKNHRIKMKNKIKKTLQQPILLLLLKGNSVD